MAIIEKCGTQYWASVSLCLKYNVIAPKQNAARCKPSQIRQRRLLQAVQGMHGGDKSGTNLIGDAADTNVRANL